MEISDSFTCSLVRENFRKLRLRKAVRGFEGTIMDAIDLKSRLGAAIKRERSVLGISQKKLAYRAGLHRTYVSDVECGVRNPSIESIEKLAQALRVSVSNLFERATNGNRSRQPVEILLVEGNPRDVDLTKHAFAKANISNSLHVARDGAAALDFVFGTCGYARRRRGPGALVVLLDLNLPKVSGLEVLRRIKGDERTHYIPVIVLIASARDRDINECRQLGVENYIVKPVGFHNFSEVIPRLSLAWTLVTNGRVNGFTLKHTNVT